VWLISFVDKNIIFGKCLRIVYKMKSTQLQCNEFHGKWICQLLCSGIKKDFFFAIKWFVLGQNIIQILFQILDRRYQVYFMYVYFIQVPTPHPPTHTQNLVNCLSSIKYTCILLFHISTDLFRMFVTYIFFTPLDPFISRYNIIYLTRNKR
jgi:hypothetical protein